MKKKVQSNFSLEMYLRFDSKKNIALSAYSWLIHFGIINFTTNFETEFKSITSIAQLLEQASLSLSLFSTEDKELFLQELGQIPELFNINETSDEFIKFVENAKAFIPFTSKVRSNKYMKNSAIIYFHIYRSVSLIQLIVGPLTNNDALVSILSSRLYSKFMSLLQSFNTKINDEKFLDEILKWLSKQTFDHFENNEERRQYILNIFNDLIVGSPSSPDTLKFFMFWDQFVSRDSYFEDYLNHFIKEILMNYRFDIYNKEPITVTKNTLGDLTHSIVAKTHVANTPKAMGVKLFSVGMVALGLAVTYIPFGSIIKKITKSE